jgi:hypothetical protein
MDTKKLFQRISQRMRADFNASAEIGHSGSKGTVREHFLCDFLRERLPQRYGIGSGEIAARTRNTLSRQCDVIVYDKLNGVVLYSSDNMQVYPVDCVYGIIEVKSALSKAELLDALEKIKVLKEMAPRGLAQATGPGFISAYHRPQPFGMVFAYGLAANSLDSLLENLKEWEAQNPPTVWPNYICVLETGVIEHTARVFERCIGSDQITAITWPHSTPYGEDSLFQFYMALHDVCARMHLGIVELHHYYDPPLRIGRFIVAGRGMEGTSARPESAGQRMQLKEATIERIVNWCASRGKMPYAEVMKLRLGQIPTGMEGMPLMKWNVYFYNPDNLPGLQELKIRAADGGGVEAASPNLALAIELLIDNEVYVIAPLQGPDDYEQVD